MLIERWMLSITERWHNSRLQLVVRPIWYAAILTALICFYSNANMTLPNFVYQGF